MSHRRPATIADRHIDELLRHHPQLARVTEPCFSFSQEAIDAKSVEMTSGLTDAEKALRISNDPTYLLCEDVSLWSNWQSCRHVYRFDRALTDALLRTSFPDSMPMDALGRLPYPCLFVEADMPMSLSDGSEVPTHGFFAWKDRTITAKARTFEEGTDCISVTQLVDGRPRSTMSVNLGVETLGEVIEEAMAFDLMEARRASESGEAYVSFSKDYEAMLREHYNQILSHLLYIVAENSDQTVEYRPSGKSRRRSACKATIHAVGTRVGRSLGASRVVYESNDAHETGRTVRAHVRSGHWHHFWTGPMDGERNLVLRWVKPTLVNARNGKIDGTVVHKASK